MESFLPNQQIIYKLINSLHITIFLSIIRALYYRTNAAYKNNFFSF